MVKVSQKWGGKANLQMFIIYINVSRNMPPIRPNSEHLNKKYKKPVSAMSCKLLIITIITIHLCPVSFRKRRWQWPKPKISWRATHTLPMTLTPRPCLHTPWLCYEALTHRWPCAASTTWPSHKVLPHSSL